MRWLSARVHCHHQEANGINLVELEARVTALADEPVFNGYAACAEAIQQRWQALPSLRWASKPIAGPASSN
jgi:hypothetical protein